jgi:hypothetical protein
MPTGGTVPGDEVQDEAAAGSGATAKARRGRTGPRHAAPRKPLLTRLHVPAGKAIAMAAMPSAVLLGMGLTPQLASAKSVPKNPFREGPCVSAPDREEPQDEKEKDGKGKEDGPGTTPDPSGSASPSPSPSGEDPGEDARPAEPPSAGEPEAPPEPEPSPSRHPLDPLGIGEALGDLLSPGDDDEKDEEEEGAATPSPSPTNERGDGEDGGEDGDSGEESAAPGDEPEDGAGGSPSPSPTPSASQTTPPGADGKEPFPCPEEKKVAGENEQTPTLLADKPWYLESSRVGLHGLDYKGVVNVRTASGNVKQALKFTAESVDIRDLHQIVVADDGTQYHVRSQPGSTSTIRGGQVTLYTERLEGNLLGLIPIVFDPEHQPPLNLPEVFFTNVKITQAGQFGGNLTVPGLKSTIE